MSEEFERNQRERLAYHEAGHAAAAVSLGRGVGKATIVPEPPLYSGYVDYAIVFDVPTLRRNPREMDNQIVLGLAGPVAQARASGQALAWEDEDDFLDAVELLTGINVLSAQVEGRSAFEAIGAKNRAHLITLIDRTERTMDEHWGEVEAIAAALLKSGTLSGDEVHSLFG